MNIWIFNQYAITPDLPGGTRHYDLGRELVKRGHRVTVFASDFIHYVYRYHRTTPKRRVFEENVDGIDWVWIRTVAYHGNSWRRIVNMVDFSWKTFWVAIRRKERPDVIIGSSPHLLVPLCVCFLSRLYRVPFIMEIRDLWPQVFVDMGVAKANSVVVKLLALLAKTLYHRAQHIVVLGPQMREHIAKLGIDYNRISWIPNGADLTRFESVPPPSGGRSLKVMYLGAHGPANALDTLIEAAKIVQDSKAEGIQFILVGDGPEKPRLVRMAEELGLDNVEFRSPVPKSRVPEVLCEADVLVVTYAASFFNSGGSLNKLNDYMAAGRPVVLAVELSYDPVKEAGCGLTVAPEDPHALAEAIVGVCRLSSKEREAMGRRGREYVQEHHDIKKLAEELEEIVNRVVARRSK